MTALVLWLVWGAAVGAGNTRFLEYLRTRSRYTRWLLYVWLGAACAAPVWTGVEILLLALKGWMG